MSLKAHSVQNSYRMPQYLGEHVDTIAKKLSEGKQAYTEAILKKQFADGEMSREAFVQHVDHEYHGHGVREALADMSIWEESGGKIYRKQECQREVEAVLKLINENLVGDKE